MQNSTIAPVNRALTATTIVAKLAQLNSWSLVGSDASVAIEKAFPFGNFYETMAFVNAVAYIAHRLNHHPDLAVQFDRCVVQLRTHDANGITTTDFECAAQIDALLASGLK